MSKTFNYCIEVGCSRYSEQTDEEFCDTVDYDYSVSNDEIEEATGKRRSDYSVVKKQRYNNQRRKRNENWTDRCRRP